MQLVPNPFPLFNGLDGLALEDGYIYIGTENLDPETNPVSVYWDELATQPASQPIRTLAGYPDSSGSPGQIWASGRYSIRVRDALGNQVFYLASAGPTDRPYLIHTQYLGASPGAQAYVCIHMFGEAVSLGANLANAVWAYVATNPSSTCNFDLRKNGISFGTLTISTAGAVTVSSTAQSFAIGDRMSIVAPSVATDLVNLAITIAGTLS